MAENQLIPVSDFNVPAHLADKKMFEEVAGGGDYFARIQLMNNQSRLVQDEKLKKGEYALITRKDSFVNLTDSFDCLVIAWLPKALEINGEEISAYYDPRESEFQRIKAASFTPNSGRMFGPEFFLYVPSVQKYATFHMASKSARAEAENLVALVGAGATLSSQKASGKKFQWIVPIVVPCSSLQVADLPPLDEIKEKADKFLNPKKEEKIKAEPVAGEEERAR